ncbi:MAG: PLDc N-terminal domain-containing protein [Actinomycetota bacterium]|nr:PLDc N-terminal domain-containing protein [Actinomycetota bacterium]
MSYVWIMFWMTFVPWIASLLDAALVPRGNWQEANLDKTTWIVLLVCANFVGAIAYFGWVRRRVRP